MSFNTTSAWTVRQLDGNLIFDWVWAWCRVIVRTLEESAGCKCCTGERQKQVPFYACRSNSCPRSYSLHFIGTKRPRILDIRHFNNSPRATYVPSANNAATATIQPEAPHRVSLVNLAYKKHAINTNKVDNITSHLVLARTSTSASAVMP